MASTVTPSFRALYGLCLQLLLTRQRGGGPILQVEGQSGDTWRMGKAVPWAERGLSLGFAISVGLLLQLPPGPVL